eukprot:366516-Chlamydomonas_euryale.AAC.10
MLQRECATAAIQTARAIVWGCSLLSASLSGSHFKARVGAKHGSPRGSHFKARAGARRGQTLWNSSRSRAAHDSMPWLEGLPLRASCLSRGSNWLC